MILGIEIGGTKLQLGVSGGQGVELSELARFAVQRDQGAAGILGQIEQAAGDLIKRHQVTSVGFGFGGPVDPERRSVITSHQVHGWDGFPLVDWCRQHLRRPAVIGNDCNVAALAEARLGAGRGHQRVFFVTVGTGIGGGFTIDGRIDGQNRPAIAEVGHLRPGTAARDAHHTVESLASGLGIERRLRQRLAKEIPEESASVSDLLERCEQNPEQLTTQLIAAAARDGNRLAQATIDRAIEVLGWAIAQTITLLAPHRVVVGGGVSLIGEPFFATLRQQVARYVFPPLADQCAIVPAALGELSVVHGAIQLAAQSSIVGFPKKGPR